MQLSGKNVLFLGGFGGIGLATCKELINKNLNTLAILDCRANEAALKELQALDPDCKVKFFKVDVTMEYSKMKQTLKQILSEISKVDIFIYGAGICNEFEIELTVQINLLGMIKLISLLLPQMDKSKGNGGGMIVNIASAAGLNPVPILPVYCATKAAMISFTRSLAQPNVFNKTGVSMLAICPGATKTNILNNVNTFLNVDPNFTKEIVHLNGQSAEECGSNIVKAIEQGENDSIWLLDEGNLELVQAPTYNWNKAELNKIMD